MKKSVIVTWSMETYNGRIGQFEETVETKQYYVPEDSEFDLFSAKCAITDEKAKKGLEVKRIFASGIWTV